MESADVKAKERRIEDPPIIRDFSLSVTRRTVRFIYTSSGGISDPYYARRSLVASTSYYLTPGRLQELPNQLQELLDLSFIGSSFRFKEPSPYP